MKSEDAVKRYYDLNTRRFLRFGHASRASAIHRSIRHPGLDDPFRVQEQLLLQLLRRHRIATVLDLGCGVGASLLWLSHRHPARYYGVTLSPLQAEMAREHTSGTGIEIRQGSYLDSDMYQGLEDRSGSLLVYGIESWLHCADPARYMELVAGTCRPGDLLALWDDFPVQNNPDEPAQLWDDFRKGWHALNVMSPGETDRLARENGFELVSDRDLTPFLVIDRPRDYLTAAMVFMLRPLGLDTAWWQNLRGGGSLRRLLKSGRMAYRFRVWRRS